MKANNIPLVSVQDIVSISEVLEYSHGSKAVENAFRASELPSKLRHEQDLFIPNSLLVSFIEICARQSGSRYFGLEVGENFPFTALGPYGEYVTRAADLGEALFRASHALCFYESGSRLTIKDLGSSLQLAYYPASPHVLGARHQSDALACMLIGLVRHFAGPNWNPEFIELNYDDVSRRSVLEGFFKAPVHFGGVAIAISIPKNILSLQRPTETEISNLFTIHDVRRKMSNQLPRDFTGTVLGAIDIHMLDGFTDIEHIAKWFNLGTRSLQRRLHQEGWSYRDLLQAKRLERATELLIETNATITVIATTLGYSSKQHFIRAYKKMAGVTPGRARQHLCAQAITNS